MCCSHFSSRTGGPLIRWFDLLRRCRFLKQTIAVNVMIIRMKTNIVPPMMLPTIKGIGSFDVPLSAVLVTLVLSEVVPLVSVGLWSLPGVSTVA